MPITSTFASVDGAPEGGLMDMDEAYPPDAEWLLDDRQWSESAAMRPMQRRSLARRQTYEDGDADSHGHARVRARASALERELMVKEVVGRVLPILLKRQSRTAKLHGHALSHAQGVALAVLAIIAFLQAVAVAALLAAVGASRI